MDGNTPIITNTNSRIGRGLNARRTMTKNSENILGNTGTFSNTNTFSNEKPMDLSNTANIPRQRGSFAANEMGSTGSNNMYNPSQGQYGRKPLISEQQIDQHTGNLQREINSLDQRLQKSSNGFQQQQSSYENAGFVKRMRDSRGMSNQGGEGVKRTTGNSFNGRSTNTSLNAAFGQEQQGGGGGLDVFEEKEKQLKMQLQQIEKQREQKEKIEEIKSKAHTNNLNNKNNNNDQDLLLKLSSPTFNTKKSNNNNNNNQQSNNNNPFAKPGLAKKPSQGMENKNWYDNSNSKKQQDDQQEDFGDYMPGNFGRDTKSKLNREGITGKKKPPLPVKNKEDEAAVATGVQDTPFEDSQMDEAELIQCPEGCGRQFHEKALEKHIPICKKVFQQKRQEFNTQKTRVVDAEQNKLARQGKIKEKIQKKDVKKDAKRNTSTNLAEIKKKMKQQKEQMEAEGKFDQV